MCRLTSLNVIQRNVFDRFTPIIENSDHLRNLNVGVHCSEWDAKKVFPLLRQAGKSAEVHPEVNGPCDAPNSIVLANNASTKHVSPQPPTLIIANLISPRARAYPGANRPMGNLAD
jgi:hypothetical protein